jgi:hypothetical protein
MTEPDLVEVSSLIVLFVHPATELYQLGDNVSIDNASVVAYINSRGDFALNNLKIGNG